VIDPDDLADHDRAIAGRLQDLRDAGEHDTRLRR
jgi:hypothetical protein